MRRLPIVLVGLAVVAASCSGDRTESAIEPAPPVAEVTSTATPPTTISTSTTDAATSSESRSDRADLAGTTTTTTLATTTTEVGPPPEGKPAPDFTLALGEDGTESFTLSEEAAPVFMVFWAEW